MNPLHCKSCGIRLFWSDKDRVTDLLCFSCAEVEEEYACSVERPERTVAEIQAMVHEEERRE